MFDAATAQLLRSAQELPGLDPNDLPAILTAQYAQLASMRLRGVSDADIDNGEWSLERIADTYELIVSLQPEAPGRAAAAFVAGTARQIIGRRQALSGDTEQNRQNMNRDRLDPTLAAALLFLAAEQYADAHEAAASISPSRDDQTYEVTILSEHIVDLATGRLVSILERAARWRRPIAYGDIDERAFAALIGALSTGVEMLAAQMMKEPLPEATGSRFETAQQAFERVIRLSCSSDETSTAVPEGLIVTFPGPYHAASLLLAVARSMQSASLLDAPLPSGASKIVWEKWLRFRAEKFPYLWSNHRSAIQQNFYETGTSAVVVLPTGAGKTTVSSLKIAGVLARGKKVAFLAPTHALVEQLTEDLQEMFPKELFGSVVSNDFDLLMQEDAVFQDIEVMTPERCLAMLSFAPEAFQDVGLLVFDECHLLSPEAGKVRRALDAMLCLLGFHHVAPDADLLLLSAMIRNGNDLAQWLEELTGRPAASVDLIWKPSRQARGVVIYDGSELELARKAVLQTQAEADKASPRPARSLRAAAERKLTATVHAIWGLQHNWLSSDETTVSCITTKLLDDQVQLAGHIKFGPLQITPNANQVAIQLAAAAAERGLKTIVFVNAKREAVSIAKGVSDLLSSDVQVSELEARRWEALKVELGDLKHSLLSGPTAAVPHNSLMLRLERDIAERMFKRADGAQVIVATPTLAQGLNLPAQLAILAGDKRGDADRGGRTNLEAHELLNAAARAGRAGHLANGLVLLIPEPVISFKNAEPLDISVVEKLQAVLPEDDHCVTVVDPVELVIDRLMSGQVADPDVLYTVNRMAVIQSTEATTDTTYFFDLRKSLGAYVAKKSGKAADFDAKIDALKQAIESEALEGVDQSIAILSSQSGLPASLLTALRARIQGAVGSLPTNVVGWITWLIKWLQEDQAAQAALLGDTMRSILTACGKNKTAKLLDADLDMLLSALSAWVEGKPLREIEVILGGEPDAVADVKRVCPRTRELAGTIIPRGISFSIGLVAHVVEEVNPFDQQADLDRQLVDCLGTLVRKGFNEVGMLSFASDRKNLLSRVQVHQAWQNRFDDVFEEIL